MEGTVVNYLLILIRIYYWLIIVRVLVSWIPLPDNQVVRTIHRWLYDLTEPYLRVFRRLVPGLGRGGIGLDISPILAIIFLIIVQEAILRLS